MAKPEIRLKGFDGEWDKKELCSLYEPSSIKNKIYGADKIISVANMYFKPVSYISDDEYLKSYNVMSLGDIAFEGNKSKNFAHGRFVENTIGDGIVSHVFVVLKPISKKYDLQFWKYYINYERIMGPILQRCTKHSTMMTDIVVADFLKESILVPSYEEQKKIGQTLKSLDSMIKATTDKIASLKQMRQACLVSMFPQAGETTPRVRFKGFEGEWDYLPMSDMFMERHDISTITDNLPQLSFTIEEGVIRPEDRKTNKRDFLIKDKSNKKYLVTRLDDIIYNPANVIYGAIHKNSLCDGVVSPIYKIFYTQQDPSFMECVVRRPEFIKEMTIYMEGTVQKLRTLKPEAFLRMSAYIAPSLEEQKKIGYYFRSLDKQISLLEKRLEKLKQIKAACLDKMFV